MRVSFTSRGNFNKMEKFLREMENAKLRTLLAPYGKAGVDALRAATPSESGETAELWDYEIVETRRGVEIVWTNDNVVDGFSVAVGLQYGHATGTGGYVQGRDYINPAVKPIFDRMAEDIWKVVTTA